MNYVIKYWKDTVWSKVIANFIWEIIVFTSGTALTCIGGLYFSWLRENWFIPVIIFAVIVTVFLSVKNYNLKKQVAILGEQTADLEGQEIQNLKRLLSIETTNKIDGYTYDEIVKNLSDSPVEVPAKVLKIVGKTSSNIWEQFIKFQDMFMTGVQDEFENDLELYLYKDIAPKLILFGIVKRADRAGSMYHRVRITLDGKELLKHSLVRG